MKTNESLIVQKWLIAAFVLVLISFSSCWRTPPDEMWPTDRIERITKVRVPEYKVTKFVYGPAGIDYTDTIYIEFDSRPSDEVFEKIDDTQMIVFIIPFRYIGAMETLLLKVKKKKMMVSSN